MDKDDNRRGNSFSSYGDSFIFINCFLFGPKRVSIRDYLVLRVETGTGFDPFGDEG